MTEEYLLQEFAETHLANLISEVSESLGSGFDPHAPFGELGINSFHVLKIIKRLEEDFGSLPKSLMFEYFNVTDLAKYFVDRHQPALAAKLAQQFERSSVFEAPHAQVRIEPAQPSAPRATASESVHAEPASSASRHAAAASPIRITEENARTDPALSRIVDTLFERHKTEGCVSRGTRKIAPNLFIGTERRGYFNYARHGNIVLVYGYAGPHDYLPDLAAEIHRDCVRRGLQLNVICDQILPLVDDTAYTATPFGVLQRITNLKSFTLEGGAMRRLRYLVGKFAKSGLAKTHEYRCGTERQIDTAIVDIIDRWCAERTMVNPLIHDVRAEILDGTLDSQHRLFLTWLDDTLQNVILITRMSAEENGYLMDLEFYPPEMPLGGLEFAITRIIDVLAAEGFDLLSLGGTYGCKLEACEQADPAVDALLDELREQNIFNDEGNLQFKNKFRPENRSLYLCRAVGSGAADNVLDIIMMIADPLRMRTPDEGVSQESASEHAATAPIAHVARAGDAVSADIESTVTLAGNERSRVLASAGFNPLAIPHRHVDFDLKSDSWALLQTEEIDAHMQTLHARLQQPINLDESLRALFPFSQFTLTESGEAAENVFFSASERNGLILQNLLFPSTVFHQIDKGFKLRELPDPVVFRLDADAQYKGDIAWDALREAIASDPGRIAMVCIEVSDNAAGGHPVSLRRLKDAKALLAVHGIPLVIDATRVVDNAYRIVELETDYAGKSIWAVVRELLACADVVIGSLTKNFCVKKGGIVACNDIALSGRMRERLLEHGGGLDTIDRRLVALSLQNRKQIESRVARRMEAVRQVWAALHDAGVPLAHPAGAHCVLIDVKRIPQFRGLKLPVASFLAWLYQSTGIRASAHSVGMQMNTPLNDLVRLAVPVGMDQSSIDELITRLLVAFKAIVDVPDLVAEPGASPSGHAQPRYRLQGYLHLAGTLETTSSDAVAPAEPITAKLMPTDSEGSPTRSPAPAVKRTAATPGQYGSGDVAIVGMAGRYPKANSMAECWQNLANGRDCIEDFPIERWQRRQQHEPVKRYRGGFIDCIDRFDSMFFNISPREAEMLDPQERLFLEVAWEAVEDAGYYPEVLAQEGAERKIGVYVGAVWTMYQMLGVEERHAGHKLTPNSFLWSIANRVSYCMNLTGPSLTLDTACSSSLTAIYLACEAIKAGECSAAIVGGVNLDIHQAKLDINQFGGALSADGVCRSFGKDANGYVAGEGVGALFMKPLERALQDGDHVYGVIKSAVVNHGGRTSGYTVPNPKAQADLVAAALDNAGIDARSIGYIEAHGTGTELGDPIEIAALDSAFQTRGVGSQSCSIGSIKSNIGHLEAAAGVVGVTKVLLQMKHRSLVPSLHSSELNEFIDFANSRFRVQQNLEEWTPKTVDGTRYPLRAGVSSFGAGGANAHIVLEEHVPAPRAPAAECDRIFPLSARSEDQLRQMVVRLLAFLENDASECDDRKLADIAHTLQVGRKSFDCRLAVVARSRQQLIERLKAYLAGGRPEGIATGQIKDAASVTRLLSRAEKEEFAQLLSQRRDPAKLAELWAAGLLADWQGFGGEGRRVPLPTYPFADKRHWVGGQAPLRRAGLPSAPLHPMLDSNESTFERQIFKKSIHDRDFFIYDHKVSEIPTLPGVAYLELARKAGEIAAGRKVQKIRNVLWVSPIAVQGSVPKDVRIELKPSGEVVQFEVFSGEDEARILHSQGKLLYATQQTAATTPEYIDLAAIRSRCEKVIDGPQVYPLFESLGLQLGPSFQVLQDVYRNEEETLGTLKLPHFRTDDLGDMILHPSLVDGSLQAGMAGQLGSKGGEMFVPFSIGEVEILHPLPPICYSYVTEVKDQRKVASQVLKTNVLIVDESGKVLVRIRESTGVPLREVHKEQAANADADGFARLYYAYDWEASALPVDGSATQASSLLLFAVDDMLRTGCAHRDDVDRVITVRPGECFQRMSDCEYRIDPGNRDDYRLLIDAVQAAGAMPENIAFAWPMGNDEDLDPREDAGLDRALALGAYSFLFLCQALIQRGLESSTRLIYAYANQLGEAKPHHEAIGGFVKTLQLEHPKFSCSALELGAPDGDAALDTLLTEFSAGRQDAACVRYEAGARFVRRMKRFDLEATRIADPIAPREHGTYLITGGAGGLGLIFAKYLARMHRARLVLSGRSAPTADLEAKLDGLRKAGAEVLYVTADVACREDVASLLEQARTRFGALHGVIHAAGVLRDALIRNKTAEEMRAVFAPKIFGLRNIDESTCGEPLDFFVTFSSLAGVAGNAGQCDYSFANHYMDSFAARRAVQCAKGERQGKTLSINWSLWADGGMKLDEQTELYFRKTLGIKPLTTEAGIDAFLQGLASDRSQFAVLQGMQEKIELAWGLRKKTPSVAAVVANPESSGDLEAWLERGLSQIVMEFLKLDAADVATDKILLDLGFDSLGLTTFANAVNDRYQLDITPVLFFDYPSIGEIAKYLATERESDLRPLYATPANAAASGVSSFAAPDSAAPAHSLGKGWDPSLLERGQSGATSDGAGFSPRRRFIEKPLAIVGMSGVMPQSSDLEAFWDHLKNARDLITVIPESRWRWEDYYGDPQKDPNTSNSKWGGFMHEVDKFDPLFFGISPREAAMMDPQQRIFLETVWKAIEDSGQKVSDLSGTRTGLFVGVATNDYIDIMNGRDVPLDGYTASGNSHSVLANRVSFLLNLRGPSAPIDTACSSSLVALHRAVESIHTGSCDMAIVGGVQVMLSPAAYISFGTAGMLSSDGKCKTFDKRADGYVRGEGAGAILIKSLAAAEADGNHIYAIIKSTAENHGGRVTTLTAPNSAAQAELLIEAYEKAEIDPATVGYIECHGTGTPLGDPIEIQALTKAFAELYKRNDRPPAQSPHCGLSSVKTNIGHLETAAGIAGLLKLLLAMRHRQIPANIHLDEVNPYINLKGTPFYIADKLTPWQSPTDQQGRQLPRRAGISSFGFGGANAHIVLEEYVPPTRAQRSLDEGPHLIVLSAKNEDRLKAYAQSMRDYLATHEVDLVDLAFTMQVGRDEMQERLALIVSSRDELIRKFDGFIAGENAPTGMCRGNIRSSDETKPARVNDGSVQESLERRDLSVLAMLWVSGAKIDWRLLYESGLPRRISIPSYPFARQRYWMPGEGTMSRKRPQQAPETAAALHPLIQRNVSTLQEQKFATSFTGTEFYLADHVIASQKILPGVAYMEMARVAGELAGSGKVGCIRNLVWERPIIVGEEPGEVEIALVPAGDEVKFRVCGAGQRSNVTHCHGRLAYAAEEHGESVERHDIEAIKRRCGEPVVLGDELYAFLNASGLMLGSSFRIVQSIHATASESLSVLQLPEHLRADAGMFLLHPALMDGSLHTAMGLLRRNGMDVPMSIPFSVAEVQIFHSLETLQYGYATWASSDPKGNPNNLKVDFDLIDGSGRVLVRIKELVSRPLRNPDSNASRAVASPLSTVTASKPLYYQRVWIDAAARTETLPSGDYLIFDRSEHLREALRERLLGLQPVQPRIALVGIGPAYRELEQDVYEIDPGQEEHYRLLFQSLSAKGMPPVNIVHAWSGMDFGVSEESLELSLQTGVFSLLYLSQSLLQELKNGTAENRLKGQKIRLFHLFPSDQQHAQPQHAAIAGFLRSLSAELPQFLCRNIELQGDGPTTLTPEDIAVRMVVELQDGDGGNAEVRYVGGGRQVRKNEALHLPQAGKLNLRQHGVYVITGGSGGLGSIFAQHLAQQLKARLALVGRSAPGAAQEEQIRSLEPLAGEVAYFQADIGKFQEVRRVMQEIRSHFGRIDGVIHCAGVLCDSPVAAKSAQDLRDVFAAKINGTIHIDAATAEDDLDCFVLFSSLTAATGNSGQADYAYANRFLDEFAELRDLLRGENMRSGRTVSFNWPLWREGGMRADQSFVALLEQATGIRTLETPVGLDAFADVLASDQKQVMVLQGDRGKIDRMLGITATRAGQGAADARSDSVAMSATQTSTAMTSHMDQSAQDRQLASLIKNDLLKIVTRILMIDEEIVSHSVDMSEYGFDSIGLTQFFRDLNDKYALDLTPAVFFEYPTLESLSRFLCDEHRQKLQKHYAGYLNEIRVSEPLTPVHAPPAPISGESRFSRAVSNPRASDTASVASARKDGMQVAVVGMSGIMPQSEDLNEFWEQIAAEKDLITEIPSDRWDWAAYQGNPFAERNKTNSRWGGFMKEVDKFDSAFFGISPLEAELMDPQQRLFLQTVWKTIEDAGHKPADLAGTKTGVFVGVAGFDYLEVLQKSKTDVIAYTATGMSHCVLPNRISYLLDLHGPSEPVDTACSSSLVAIAHAVDAIASGDCEMAIAGGVNVLLSPSLYLAFGNAGMLSSDGRCKSFDSRADGYVRGEGCGAVLLKPLDRAIADGNHIYGIVKGAAVNHGGHATSLTAPNPNAQAELLIDVYEKAQIDPNAIGYIEAHGTGTPLGDPVEINGLKKAFKELYRRSGRNPREHAFCGVGSVKTNIGHLEMAAGIASFIKVLLAMKHRKIPANIHHEQINPHIRLDGSPFYIVDKTQDWVPLKNENGVDLPRTAGISSFGFGGSNAHVVVQEYVGSVSSNATAASSGGDADLIIPLSSKTPEQLQKRVEDLLAFLRRENFDVELTSLAYTLQVGREAMDERLGFLVNSVEQLAEKLQAYVDGKPNISGTWKGQVKRARDGLSIIGQDDEIKQTIVDQCIARKQLGKLLDLWVNGLDFDWNRMYDGSKPRRISLPTYPFARTRYWIESKPHSVSPASHAHAAPLHPLVHTNTSDLRRLSYRTVFDGQEFFLRDSADAGQHLDGGRFVPGALPAAVYLEMARAAVVLAGSKSSDTDVVELQDIVWGSPFVAVAGKPLTVEVFKDADERICYDIYSLETDEQGEPSEIVHCRGAAILTERGVSPPLDIRQLLAQMQVVNSNMEATRVDRYKGSGQELLRIDLPEVMESTHEDLVLHPVLMGSALQAAVDLLQDSNSWPPHSFYPISLESLKVLSPCASGMYAWARYARGSQASDDVVKIDVTLIDEAGNACVVMKSLNFDNCSGIAGTEEQRIDFERILNFCSHTPASDPQEHEAESQADALEEMLDYLAKG